LTLLLATALLLLLLRRPQDTLLLRRPQDTLLLLLLLPLVRPCSERG
jgi:hypothetical protein